MHTLSAMPEVLLMAKVQGDAGGGGVDCEQTIL
jgi:hypothetical protein